MNKKISFWTLGFLFFSLSYSFAATKTFSIDLSKKESVQHFKITKPGIIKINAQFKSNHSLALILNGPGQVGYYARKDGHGPLYINYYVTEAVLKRGIHWKASVKWFPESHNAKNTSMQGIMKISFSPQIQIHHSVNNLDKKNFQKSKKMGSSLFSRRC